jgi:hypothetical protein
VLALVVADGAEDIVEGADQGPAEGWGEGGREGGRGERRFSSGGMFLHQERTGEGKNKREKGGREERRGIERDSGKFLPGLDRPSGLKFIEHVEVTHHVVV